MRLKKHLQLKVKDKHLITMLEDLGPPTNLSLLKSVHHRKGFVMIKIEITDHPDACEETLLAMTIRSLAVQRLTCRCTHHCQAPLSGTMPLCYHLLPLQ